MAAKWAVFADFDSCSGENATIQRTSDFEMCKRYCEQNGYSGFVHRAGEVFFRSAPPDQLFNRKMPSRGATLFLKVPQGMHAPHAAATAVPLASATAVPMATAMAVGAAGAVPVAAATAMYQGAPPHYGGGPQYPQSGGQGAPAQQGTTYQMLNRLQQMPGQQMPPQMQPYGAVPNGDRPNNMVTPPTEFPQLSQCEEDHMEFMLSNSQLLDDWIVALKEVKAMEDRIQQTREEGSSISEQILAREPEFAELCTKYDVALAYMATRAPSLQALNGQRAEILARQSPKEIAELLAQLALDAEETGELAFNAAMDTPELDNSSLRNLRTTYVDYKSKKHVNQALAEYLRGQAAS